MRRSLTILAMVATGCSIAPARAQSANGPLFSIEAATQERRRGLDWSDGKPVVRGSVSANVANGLSVGATAVPLWNSRRHNGADAVIDMQASYDRQVGDWRLTGDAVYRFFPGAAGQGYVEVGTAAGFTLGPATVDLFARYAPRQRAIGGDNVYVGVAASVGIPATPITVSANLGRSSGTVEDIAQSQRLRPGGTYWDHGASVEYRQGRWWAGLRYANTSIDRVVDDRTGAVLTGHFGIGF